MPCGKSARRALKAAAPATAPAAAARAALQNAELDSVIYPIDANG